jgi:hypothetical protein
VSGRNTLAAEIAVHQAVALKEVEYAYGGDWHSMGFVAQWHPDDEQREMWESIYAGELDVWHALWKAKP